MTDIPMNCTLCGKHLATCDIEIKPEEQVIMLCDDCDHIEKCMMKKVTMGSGCANPEECSELSVEDINELMNTECPYDKFYFIIGRNNKSVFCNKHEAIAYLMDESRKLLAKASLLSDLAMCYQTEKCPVCEFPIKTELFRFKCTNKHCEWTTGSSVVK